MREALTPPNAQVPNLRNLLSWLQPAGIPFIVTGPPALGFYGVKWRADGQDAEPPTSYLQVLVPPGFREQFLDRFEALGVEVHRGPPHHIGVLNVPKGQGDAILDASPGKRGAHIDRADVENFSTTSPTIGTN